MLQTEQEGRRRGLRKESSNMQVHPIGMGAPMSFAMCAKYRQSKEESEKQRGFCICSRSHPSFPCVRAPPRTATHPSLPCCSLGRPLCDMLARACVRVRITLLAWVPGRSLQGRRPTCFAWEGSLARGGRSTRRERARPQSPCPAGRRA